jgi:outer membrane protein OmpA-like peptidoglycan-associated protein
LYNDALEVYRSLRQKGNPDSILLRRIAECEYGLQKQANPEPVIITKLDTTINSLGHATFSAFAMDNERTLYFTSSRFSYSAVEKLDDHETETFDKVCIAHRETVNSPWRVSVLADKESHLYHEGILNVSFDGQYLFIFRGNNEILVQNLQHLPSEIKFVPLAQAFNLKVSNKYHISSLALINTNNTQTIYMCIDGGKFNKELGYGGYDIWYTTRDQTAGKWSELTNMGAPFNTSGNEISISILPDGKTIFFASDGLQGVGGYDIYRSTYNDSLKGWGKPVHLGHPINTPNNDVYYNPVANNPRHAYYSVGRPDVADAYDVCLVNYYGDILSDEEKEVRHLEFVRALGKVKEVSLKPKDAKLLTKKKYVKLSEKTPKKVGVKMILQEIQFPKSTSKLLLKSYPSLDALYCWLNWNPSLRIRISGYTDNVGSKAANVKLSRARAQSIANYLIGKGIDPYRLTVKGYGTKRPLTTNKTEDGRALNNRVEVSIIK